MDHPDILRAMKTGYPVQDDRYEEELQPLEEPDNDSPVEDHFGCEIKDGDEWFYVNKFFALRGGEKDEVLLNQIHIRNKQLLR